MSPAELLAASDHLAVCEACRQGAIDTAQAELALSLLRADLRAEASKIEADHLSYEQIAALADGELDAADREVVESHLELCSSCADEAADLRAFRASLATTLKREIAAGGPSGFSERLRVFWRSLAAWDKPRLAAAFATHSRGPGANWCTYATWASRQAGETIRGENVLDDLQRRLSEGRWLLHPLQTLWRRLLRRGLLQPGTRVGRLTAELHTPLDAVGRASTAVARGNLEVFAEIGLEFARRLERDKPLTFSSPGRCPPAIVAMR